MRDAYPELWRLVRGRPTHGQPWRQYWIAMLTLTVVAGAILLAVVLFAGRRLWSVGGVAIAVAITFVVALAVVRILRRLGVVDAASSRQ